jgi:ATP-dependent helicase/nuclease subunit B
VLRRDLNIAPFSITGLETPVSFPLNIGDDTRGIRIITGGIIDRVDMKDGITRILDYKTGSIADSIRLIDELFKDDRQKDLDGWLQTLLYCEGYINENHNAKVRPVVYQTIKIKSGKNDERVVDDYASVRQEFIKGLTATVKAVFSMNEPFRMTRDDWNKCSYCPYRALCMR